MGGQGALAVGAQASAWATWAGSAHVWVSLRALLIPEPGLGGVF